jgi:hypothetical protein
MPDDDDDDWPSPDSPAPVPPAPPAPDAARTVPPAAPTMPSEPPEMTIVSEAPSEIVDAMRAAYLSDQQIPAAPASDHRSGDENIDPNAPTLMREAPSEARAGLAAFADGGFPAPRPPAGDEDPTMASALGQDARQVQQPLQPLTPPFYAPQGHPQQAQGFAQQQQPMQQQQPAYPQHAMQQGYPQQPMPQQPHGQQPMPQQPYGQQPMQGQGPWGGRMPFQAPPSPKNDQQRLIVLLAVGLGAAFFALLLMGVAGFLLFGRHH